MFSSDDYLGLRRGNTVANDTDDRQTDSNLRTSTQASDLSAMSAPGTTDDISGSNEHPSSHNMALLALIQQHHQRAGSLSAPTPGGTAAVPDTEALLALHRAGWRPTGSTSTTAPSVDTGAAPTHISSTTSESAPADAVSSSVAAADPSPSSAVGLTGTSSASTFLPSTVSSLSSTQLQQLQLLRALQQQQTTGNGLLDHSLFSAPSPAVSPLLLQQLQLSGGSINNIGSVLGVGSLGGSSSTAASLLANNAAGLVADGSNSSISHTDQILAQLQRIRELEQQQQRSLVALQREQLLGSLQQQQQLGSLLLDESSLSQRVAASGGNGSAPSLLNSNSLAQAFLLRNRENPPQLMGLSAPAPTTAATNSSLILSRSVPAAGLPSFLTGSVDNSLQSQTATRLLQLQQRSAASASAPTVRPAPAEPRIDPSQFPNLPCVLAQADDTVKLSSHQVLLRHQIEAFEASEDDLLTHTRGRNKPIQLGQVGIRCRHCARVPVSRREKGSTYFPATTLGLYQAAQNMSTTHMQSGLCPEMPDSIKEEFARLSGSKLASSGAGRPYWAASAKKLGLIDTAEKGIRSVKSDYFLELQSQPQQRTQT